MGVNVRIPGVIAEQSGGERLIRLPACPSVRECLESLVRQYPGLAGELFDDRGILLLRWVVALNDRICSEELSRAVKDGDTIALEPLIAGG